MHRTRSIALWTGLWLVLAGCNGPIGLLPGGEIDGESRPAPDRWALEYDAGTAQLETDPSTPYSVNVAYTQLGGSLYVNAGGTRSGWVERIEADPRVRLRIDGVIYELRAERVTDPGEVIAFAEAWTGQSFFRRDPRGYEEVWIYRLVARRAPARLERRERPGARRTRMETPDPRPRNRARTEVG